MRSRVLHHIPLITLATVGLFSACSNEKDAFVNRTYHRLTARDNGWFNANEKLKEVVAGIERGYPENFDQVLPIFIYGTEEQAKAAVPELEKCIEKCAVVIDRHSMEFRDRQRNTWIDDAYFVIARSQFYKRNYFDSQRLNEHIARKFKGQDKQMQGKLWLARTFIQLEQYAKAQTALDELRGVKELPKRFPHDQLSAVQADLDLRRGKVDDAITNLQHAIGIADKRKDRVRWSFILAQLYQAKGYEDKAVAQYERVTKMNPPYELGFHAQIFQALAFDRGNSKDLRKKLQRMLKDDKHVDHYDMIHYALADLDLKEGKDSLAIGHLQASCRLSTTDTKQKAKSYLKLADVYFDDRAYPSAQLYYDSTTTLLDPEHLRYEEVKTRAEVLGDLVEQLEIIALEDSLQELAGLDPAEREKRVARMIREREREEEEKEQREQESRETTSTPLTPGKPAIPGSAGSGAWYFHNPSTLARGMAEFKKKWGDRALDDNWRRKDKGGSAFGEELVDDEDGGEDGQRDKETGKEAWRDPQLYLKDIPTDETAMSVSNERICEALYKSGIIYKEKLRDPDNAVESFEVLNSRFEECRYTPESYYQLYRIYLEKERDGRYFVESGPPSQQYAAIILERWPDSEFARLVRDPNVLLADEARKAVRAAEYDHLYREFRQGQYFTVISACNEVIANEPDNHLIPKYHLLKAMAVGALKQVDAFKAALTEVKNKFPGTDEAKAATDILAILEGQGQQLDPAPSKGSGYRMEQGRHYFALLFPNEAGDATEAKTKISNFNSAYFPRSTIQVTSSFLDPETQVILMSVFDTKVKAMEYYSLFLSDRTKLAGLNDQGFATFAITPDNYSELYKSKDVTAYSEFFARNYLEGK